MAVKYTVSASDLQTLFELVDAKIVSKSIDGQMVFESIDGQMIVEIDPDTLNRYFRSGTEATLSEVAAILFERPVSDSFPMGDTDPVFVFNKNPSDSVSVTESIFLLITVVRDFTDAATVSESISLAVDLVPVDSAVVSESHIYSLDKGLSDTAPVSEQLSFSTTLGPADSLLMSESLSRVVTFNRSFSDAFTLDDFTDVDAITKQVDGNKTNIFLMTEGHAMSLSKGLSDSTSVGESISINFVPGPSSVLNTDPINGFTLNA